MAACEVLKGTVHPTCMKDAVVCFTCTWITLLLLELSWKLHMLSKSCLLHSVMAKDVKSSSSKMFTRHVMRLDLSGLKTYVKCDAETFRRYCCI